MNDVLQVNFKPEPKLRLLGNRVLLQALPDDQLASSGSGLLLPNRYHKANLKFVVMAVGPGEFVKNSKGKKKRWVEPEVTPGCEVLSRHWLDASLHPDWHQPEYYGQMGAEGCTYTICDARFLLVGPENALTSPERNPHSISRQSTP
jgi:co-chaperonin GroES (HSP10)